MHSSVKSGVEKAAALLVTAVAADVAQVGDIAIVYLTATP